MILVDASTGLVISHTSAPRKRMFEDLETAAKAMREHDERKESIFRQSIDAEKNKEDLFDKKFAEALARRYSGHFRGLPRVSEFEAWTEPNLTQFLAPQWEKKKKYAPVRYRKMLNLIGQGPHLGGKVVNGIIGSDLHRNVAQCFHQVLELMRGRRIPLRSDEIDFLRQNVDRLRVSGVILRRHQSGQRSAHFGKAILDAGQSAALGIGVLSLHDAVGQILNLLLNGFNGALRHCLIERTANFMKFHTEARDLFLHARTPQRFDLVRYSAQLVLKVREVLRSVRRRFVLV